jgi:DNA-binding response OmpR family regulator
MLTPSPSKGKHSYGSSATLTALWGESVEILRADPLDDNGGRDCAASLCRTVRFVHTFAIISAQSYILRIFWDELMQAIIIAGEPEDRDYLSFVLRHAGLAVARTADTQRLRSALLVHPVDLILMVCDARTAALTEVEEIRAITQAPLVLVVERLTEAEHCAILDAGGDIALERPVSPRVLSRYARMLVKRAGTVPATVLPVIEAKGLSLDPETRRVTTSGVEPKQLTPLEFRLLYLLMTNSGHVIPIDTIIERVWGFSGAGNRELVRGLIRRLRLKINADPSVNRYIENLPGVGYRFCLD